MMNNYRQQSNPQRPRSLPPLVIVSFLTVLLIGVLSFFGSTGVSEFFHTAARPLWQGETAGLSGIFDFLASFRNTRELVAENRQLREKLNALEFSVLTCNLVRDENETLKALSGRTSEREVMLATVLTSPNRSAYDTFVIDIGRRDGVHEGSNVLAAGGVVLGVVAEVYPTSALVRLFSTPGVETEILIGPQNLRAIAEGQGGSNFVARLPQGVDVREGDVISIPSISLTPFAVVEKVIVHSTDPFQTIRFKNPINIAELKFVLVEAVEDQSP